MSNESESIVDSLVRHNVSPTSTETKSFDVTDAATKLVLTSLSLASGSENSDESESEPESESGSGSESESDSESESESESDDDYYMDLSDILRTEIENGEYTCLICTGEIDINSHIWSCDVCYRVYDLDCIKSWSQRGLKDSSSGATWKCPSCNSVKTEKVKEYRCWCNKVTHPIYNGLSPHSCGQTCNAPLKSCVHGCGSICHPGPHSECMAIGPSISCFCGRHSKQWPCIITPYDGWQCKEICNEMLPCGEHRCKQQCHSGLCGKCPEVIESICYCGKTEGKIACSDRKPNWSESVGTKESGYDGQKSSAISKWIGYFSCDKICDEFYDCEIHKCSRKCHPRDLEDHKCPLAPVEGEFCPCGQTLVTELLDGHPRSSCQDVRPTCDKTCNKTLSCGHKCAVKCHDGDCPPCRRIQSVKCGCDSQAFDVPCSFVESGEVARCRKKCAALKDCRRHRCSRICCEHEKTALERERIRKRQLRGGRQVGDSSTINNSESPIEEVHRCEEVCNLMLNCGKHRCVMTCHNGPCHPCLESSLEDYICPCGRTLMRAPIRCGSMLPKCKYKCTRDPICGHPRVDHECHDNDQECPKCPFLIEKQCVCGGSIIKGVQCHRDTVSCGKACGKPLPGCGHLCTKVCHEEGDCVTKCQSPCGKLLPCGHIHNATCHYSTTTNQSTKCNRTDCKEIVVDKCQCGNLVRKRKCTGQSIGEINSSGTTAGSSTTGATSINPVGQLKCDESCAIVERNKKLAEALGLDYQAKLASAANHKYNDDLLDIYYVDPDWADTIEAKMVEFLASVQQPPPKELRLPPMNSQRRMFVHLLAEEFNLQSMSLDSGPNRSVVLLRTSNASTPAAPLRKYYHPNSICWD